MPPSSCVRDDFNMSGWQGKRKDIMGGALLFTKKTLVRVSLLLLTSAQASSMLKYIRTSFLGKRDQGDEPSCDKNSGKLLTKTS